MHVYLSDTVSLVSPKRTSLFKLLNQFSRNEENIPEDPGDFGDQSLAASGSRR